MVKRINQMSKKEETIKTKPDIESNEEHKRDIKVIRGKPNVEFKKEEMMKTESDTYEEEKAALVSRNNTYLYSMVNIHFLLLVYTGKKTNVFHNLVKV